MKTFRFSPVFLALAFFLALLAACGNDKDDSDKDTGKSSNTTVQCPNAVTSDNTNTMTCGGQTYKTVVIGNQTWMAENLNYKATGSACYDNLESKCNTYGRLYDWETAKNVCPEGWHLPSFDELQKLLLYVDRGNYEWNYDNPYDSPSAGKHLKAKEGWNGDDTYHFTALPGGGADGGYYFSEIGIRGTWWSATDDEFHDINDNSTDGVYILRILGNSDGIIGTDYWNKAFLFSVRCIKN